jgi:hypothetical protein
MTHKFPLISGEIGRDRIAGLAAANQAAVTCGRTALSRLSNCAAEA